MQLEMKGSRCELLVSDFNVTEGRINLGDVFIWPSCLAACCLVPCADERDRLRQALTSISLAMSSTAEGFSIEF